MSTIDPETVARIAGGLTKAQRELLCSLPTNAVPWFPPRQRRIERGLAIIVCPETDQLHATATGRLVVEYLERNHD